MTGVASTSSEFTSLERDVLVLLDDAGQCVKEGCEACEQSVRESPTTFLLTAALAGYCLHRLPLRSIMVANVRVLTALLPPAVFILGTAKVLELLQKTARSRTMTP
ncbi:MAG: hypothetical protein V4662_15525 [Verrucomicrobiota bacterium]